MLALATLAGCKEDEPRRAPPPPPVVAKADACASGGGKISDAASASLFPRAVGGFCLDPNGGEKVFGEGASLPLDGICDMFDGECEIYKGFNVRRVVEARYVDGSGTSATIEVHLSKFATTDGAYAMFTKRVVGDGDPADEATPRALDAGGAAALGLGNSYLWRGLYLAEITYSDESAAEAALKSASDKVLPLLVKDMGEKLPGETSLPAAAEALPKEHRLSLGIRYVSKDILGVTGLGGGAFGYYRDGAKRYRVLAVQRDDDDQAKDTLASFAKQPGASKEKGIEGGIVRLMHREGDSPATEWVLARKGKLLLGVGDESRVLLPGMTAEEHASISLSREEKTSRLRKALSGS
ncbi:DUF6599 family protein [Chondromyces crocatus]|uniref:Uncharacterized protein n=1 Tax=Chondromyces crocatus TaxID=52 RepID=A0A0K1EET6_CHOCO|nr:DUF6599 family protein [Chondromyces crocatus]AKT39386.1 uncharacterized protein CMC5_035330 [Chondromyces crocatus]